MNAFTKINNFSQFKDNDFKNEEQMLKEFIKLKEQGIDFNLPVLDKKSIISFNQFIKEKLSVDFYFKLIKNKLVKNLMDFKIEDGYVVEDSVYNLNWMTKNFVTHKDIILDAVKNLSIELNKIPVDKFKHYKYATTYEIIDDVPPLHFLAKMIRDKHFFSYYGNRADIWDIILTHNDSMKDYISKKLTTHKDIQFFLELGYDTYYSTPKELVTILYKHGFVQDYCHNHQQRAFDVLHDCVKKDYVPQIKKLLPLYLSGPHLSEKNNYLLLQEAQSTQVANLLLENGFLIMCHVKNHDNEKQTLFSINNKMSVEVLDTILNFKPNHLQFVQQYSDFLNKEFFLDKKYFPQMKILIEKYKFPLQKYDMLNIGFKLDNKDTHFSKWFLEHGAEKNNCKEFVNTLKEEKSFAKILSQYEKIIDIHSGDFIYHMLTGKSNANSLNYYNLLSNEELDSLTSNGNPAWWGLSINSTQFSLFQKSHTKPKTIATENDSWLAHLIKRTEMFSSKAWLNQYKEVFLESKNSRYPLVYNDENKNNIFHILFAEKFPSFHLDFLINDTDIKMTELLVQSNHAGITPLELLLSDDRQEAKEKNFMLEQSVSYQALRKILNTIKEDFPFDFKVQNKRAIEIIRQWYDNESQYEILYKGQSRKNIEMILEEKNESQSKKIKI